MCEMARAERAKSGNNREVASQGENLCATLLRTQPAVERLRHNLAPASRAETSRRRPAAPNTMETSKALSLSELVEKLNEHFEAGTATVECLQTLMGSYDGSMDELRRYVYANKSKPYTRNLVVGGKHYDLMLLCWNPESESPIHDHPEAECVMKAVQGTVLETRYRLEDGDLQQERVTPLAGGATAHIDDNVGVHKVGNPGTELAASVHLYFPPIRSCHVFNEDTGEAICRKCPYDTKYGCRAISG